MKPNTKVVDAASCLDPLKTGNKLWHQCWRGIPISRNIKKNQTAIWDS